MLQESELHSLKTLLPRGQVFADRATLIAYEADAGLDKGLPEGVVFPRTVEDVVRIARWASEHRIPLVARGAGTGLSGGAVADRGGIIVDFSHMNHLLDFDPHGRTILAEPALINLRLDERAHTHGLYFPPDPSSQRASTIGGNVAENSGGPHCFKYGVTTNYVTGMDVVLADGSLVRLGGRALDYPEYDLCGLVTGSEGMLGLMTAIFLRLLRNPPGVKTLLTIFDSVEQAGAAVSAVIAAGLMPATMEMMDQKIVRIIEPFAHAGLPLDVGAVLIVEVDGYAASLDVQVNEVVQILETHGGHDTRVARTEEERYKIWLARKSAAGGIAREAPAYYTVDITVPRSRLAAMLTEVNQICERQGLRAGHVLHAGDGNLHPLLLIPDPDDAEQVARVHTAGWEMVRCCVEMGGSLTGEHGVGIEKRQYMSIMHNAAELMAMWDVKQVFDPQTILNPGKVFPLPSQHETGPFAGYTLQHREATNVDSLPPLTDELLRPESAEQAAQAFLTLAHEGRQVSLAGTGQSSAPLQGPLQMSTDNLRGLKSYAPEDLYVTVGAGTPLAEVQAFLAQHQQQIALASPWPEATIGGLVAANVNAPLRMRYGALRDQVLCATVALPDGRVIRTGRPIVKNVAGFDLSKVFIGSYGTLGLLTDISLKITALPRDRRTLLFPIDDISRGLAWSQQLLTLALTASAIVLCRDCQMADVPHSKALLAYSAEGLPEDVQAEFSQVRTVLAQAGAPEPVETTTVTGTTLWVDMTGVTAKPSLLVRIGVPVKDLSAYLQTQEALLNTGPYIADIGNGFVYLRRQFATAEEANVWLAALRATALTLEGYVVVMDMPQEFQGHINRWGYYPQSLQLMQRLQAQWDPHDVLRSSSFVVDR